MVPTRLKSPKLLSKMKKTKMARNLPQERRRIRKVQMAQN